MLLPTHKPPIFEQCCPDKPVACVWRVWLGGDDRYGIYTACADHEIEMGLAFEELKNG